MKRFNVDFFSKVSIEEIIFYIHLVNEPINDYKKIMNQFVVDVIFFYKIVGNKTSFIIDP